MAITIQNLRIAPYVQKNELKCVWGDTLTLTFAIPHVAGESYVCGIDNERVVYPPSRPVCAYTNVFTRDGDNVTFSLPLNTSKFRSYVSSIRKPMPVWLQVCRVGIDGKCETLVLDDILAIPSVLDATNTVCPGDPLKQLLEGKMDKPAAAGTEGQVLMMDADGHYAWSDLPKMDQEQADWDESDSTAYSYIRNKPAISKVGHTGEYSDLLNKPDLKPVATTGSYNDLTDKPHIPVDPVQADYGESDSTALSYIRNKPDLSVYSLVTETGSRIAMSIDENYDLVVRLLDKAGNTLSTQDIDLPIESMIVDATYANGVLTLTLQNGNTVDVDITDIVSGLVPDSRKVNGHALSSDVTISYNDLTDKPVIPAAQVQSDWDQSDSQAVDFIKNKPAIPVQAQADWDQSDSSSPAYIQNKPAMPFETCNYLTFTIQPGTTDSIIMTKKGNPPENTFEYSQDYGLTWHTVTFGQGISCGQGESVMFRNADTNKYLGSSDYYNHYSFKPYNISTKFSVSGSLLSLKDSKCMFLHMKANEFTYLFSDMGSSLIDASQLVLPSKYHKERTFQYMFSGCSSLKRGPKLPYTPQTQIGTYERMFEGCTALEEAPELTAYENTKPQTYDRMFSGCSSLKSVTVHFTSWTNQYSQSWTSDWLNGVSATGVFRCPKALPIIRDASHIPVGWTVEYIDDVQPDWDESDSTMATYIQNKPDISGDISTAIADALTFHNN